MIRFETGAERFWIGVPSKQPHEEVGHYRDALIELLKLLFNQEGMLTLDPAQKEALFDLLQLAQAMNPTPEQWQFLANLKPALPGKAAPDPQSS